MKNTAMHVKSQSVIFVLSINLADPIFFACFSPRDHNQRMHHRNHKIIGINTAYHTRLQEGREMIHRIRTEIVSKNTVLLSKIHYDVIKCQKEIELINSNFIRKDKSLKSLCGSLAKDVKLKNRCLKQMMLFSKCDTKIHIITQKNNTNVNNPVKFLRFIKGNKILQKLDCSYLRQPLGLWIKETLMDGLIDSLSEIAIIDRRYALQEIILTYNLFPPIY